MAARPAKEIRVKTIAGEKVTLQLQKDRPVAELVRAACHKIGKILLYSILAFPHAYMFEGSSIVF